MAFADSKALLELVQRQKSGEPVGIYSVCSANRFVIEAALLQAAKDGSHLLIEATCNQVNQFGGYSGMTPLDFAIMVKRLATAMGFPEEQILLGGDHLGPFPWQALPAEQAMARSSEMIRAYVEAGFCKLHLDTSMACAGEDSDLPLDPDLIAQRSAGLCHAAEQALQSRPGLHAPVYVIGTEVPVPGGMQSEEAGLQVTRPQNAEESINKFHAAFQGMGLASAWERVIALVVQPGVEFGDEDLVEYDRQAAARLSRFIEQVPGLIYEAHSTDYQRPESLRALVIDHFAILKVGPALTFAFREAVFSLARMEAEWLGGRAGIQLSGLIDVTDAAMLRDPAHWRKYYHGDPLQLAYARKYSRSDRIRYYWSDPAVSSALHQLISNLQLLPLPKTLISQYLPIQYRRAQAGLIENQPVALIHDYIMGVLQDYSAACGHFSA